MFPISLVFASQVFTNTGGPQIYVVPEGVTSIHVELHGSQGTVPQGVIANAGKGGVVTATIAVTPGEVLQLMVGDTFGFNGGGGGNVKGGGATDIRRPAFSTVTSCAYTLTCALNHRIVVAGAGGAAGSFNGSHGGDGGLVATAGTSAGTGSTPGEPGTASAGGAPGTNGGGGAEGFATAGTLGAGGILGWKPNHAGGSGGGGYYGGGGGGGATDTGASGGGGGSSWAADASAGVSNVVFTDSVNAGEGKIIVDIPSAIPNASFAFTGAPQTYTVESDVTALSVMIAGARGQAAGDVVFGRLPVTPGIQLELVLGGRGTERAPAMGTGVLTGGEGGYNGGGDSLLLNSSGYGGGGASDLRVAPYSLDDRIVVAGGGGGVYGFFVQFGWFGAAGGAETNGEGGTSHRNSWEPHGRGGLLTSGGQLLLNCHITCEPDPEASPATSGQWLTGGSGDNENRAGGGGGYYGGAANHGGGGGSSFATISGPDYTRQGVGNILGQPGAMIQHTRGTNQGDGFAVLAAMPVAITGAVSVQDDNFLFAGTVNPKHFATNPILYLGTNQQQVIESSSSTIQLRNSENQTLLAGNHVQNVSGTVGGAQVPGTYYYKVCAQTVVGLSCGNVQSMTITSQRTITFDSAGGSPVNPITASVGSAIPVPESPIREGFTFNGWEPALPTEMPNNDITVTAQWSINQYTVSFDSNGGSAITPITANFGAALTAPAAPSREGYTFTGWTPAFPTTMPSSNLTLTAQWSINQYTVSFDSNGGSAITPITANFGAALTAPAAPSREGYTFTGWTPAFPTTMPSSNLTLTAQWSINQYTVSFDSNGGSAITPITANFGAALTAPAAPSREGYTFTGWTPAFPTTMPSSNLTLTAQWEINIYTVRFLDWDDSVLQTLQVEHGQPAVISLVPERVGFSFVGWNADLSEITGDLDVRAMYEELSYLVSVNVTGAGQVMPASQTVLYGRVAEFTLQLVNENDVVVVHSNCGAVYTTGQLVTAGILANCTISVTVYDPVQIEADNTSAGPVNQLRHFRVFGGSGSQHLLEADRTRADHTVSMTDEEVQTVLVRLDDGSYRFTASRTGRYTFRFVDENSGEVVDISFDILPYLAFTSSQQQIEPGQVSSVAVWLSDEAINYPVTADFILADAQLSAERVSLAEKDDLRQAYTVSALQNNATVRINPVDITNALAGTPDTHKLVVLDEPAPLSLQGKALQSGVQTNVISKRDGLVHLNAVELNQVQVTFAWSADDLPLQVSGDVATFDPTNVQLGNYTVLITATDGRRNGQYQLLLRIIDDCPYASCSTSNGIPNERNPLREFKNRLPLCPIIEEGDNRVDNCQDQGVVFAEVPNLYTLSLGLFSGDMSWNSDQFGLALNDGALQDAGFTQVGYTVNLDILGLSVPGESVPVMIPLPVGTTIPANAVWRKFTSMHWHNFVEDDNNIVQSAKRDALNQCPVVSSDVWEAGLVEGYGCIRLIIEDGGPNDDDAQANGIIRDPGVLAIYNSYSLTFDSAGGSTIAPITQLFGSELIVPDPVREGYTFLGWSPALPATMPAENMTLTAQWQVNQYQIQFETAGGQALAPLTLAFGSAISPPTPVRQGYTFKGWNPVLPATMPARNIQATAQWYESNVAVTSTGGSMHVSLLLGLAMLACVRRIKRVTSMVLLALLPAVAHASNDWFIEASYGVAESKGMNKQLALINADPQLSGSVATLRQNSDPGYRLVLGYRLQPKWYIEAGWADLGDLIIAYDNLPENTQNSQLLAVQPQRGKGIEVATRFYLMEQSTFKPYLRAGVLFNRERNTLDWISRSDKESGNDQNFSLGVGLDYQLNEAFDLSISAHSYNTRKAKTNLLLLTVKYSF
ncbi:InlB B-repeat-containing protein [Rheinheimera sp. F8]|uniref:InlB B-repeat-containing protein n=1 Tax=Rheinheimera sp. F8 TaxID=1763998 RepID=UPI000744B833|nr:InlB B-repeat-containing protein [Rheinheimera sp. F8]ALZ77310.1 hypothetical protein ATY27_17125 [Rheinheimera sp. F8]